MSSDTGSQSSGVDPVGVHGDTSVNSGRIPATTADSKGYDPHLIPDLILLAHERPTPVTVAGIPTLSSCFKFILVV
jgi:hypothetical protein